MLPLFAAQEKVYSFAHSVVVFTNPVIIRRETNWGMNKNLFFMLTGVGKGENRFNFVQILSYIHDLKYKVNTATYIHGNLLFLLYESVFWG